MEKVGRLESLFNKVQAKIKAFLFKHEKINRVSTLTMMQLKNTKKIAKEKKFSDKVLLTIAKFVLFGLMFLIFYYGINLFMYYTKIEYIKLIYRVEGAYTILVLSLYLIVSILATSIKFVKHIYRAQDNTLLLSYPVDTGDIFISKLLVRLIQEFKKSLYIILPFLVGVYLNKATAYGLTGGYIGWAILLTLAIPVLIVAVSGVLSVLFTFLDVIFKKFNFIKIIFFVSLATAGFVMLIILVNRIPLHLQIIDLWYKIVEDVTVFVNNTSEALLFSHSIVHMLFYNKMVGFGVLMGAIIVFALLNIFVCYRFFFSLVYKPIQEKPIRLSRKSSNQQNKSIFSVFFKKEFKTYLRSEDGLITSLVYVIVLPIILYCLNRIFASFEISTVGTYMIMSIDILVSIILISASNISVANAISQEGPQFYLLKVTPIDTKQIALAKILVNVILTTLASIGVFVSLKLILDFTQVAIITPGNLVVMAVVVWLISLSHIFWSLELDITHSKVKEVINGKKENSNVTKSVFIGIGLAFLMGLLNSFFMGLHTYGWQPAPQFSILFFAILIFVARLYLLIKKLDVYFDEITM